MKRLVKANDTYVYKLESNILCKEYYIEEDLCDEYILNNSNNSFSNELESSINYDMNEMGPKGLAEYIDYDYLKLENDIIESIIINVNNSKACAIVTAIRELTTEELEIIKDYIIGQYSDGWGEGFEQDPIAIYQTEYECYDEEDEETYYGNEDVEVCISFWGDGITYQWIK